jgi:carboxyl-terminal processing protease
MIRRSPILLVVLIYVGSLFAAAVVAEESKPKEDDYELYELLVDTLDQVQRNYVKEVSRRELVEAAIRGVLSELDPYSAYIGPRHLDQFRTAVDSKFGGIGIQISMENGSLHVLSPLVGTPAYRAGVLAGDRITEIDGKSTKGIELEEAVRRLKGKEGTQVTLTVLHQESAEPEKITITREIVRVPTVLGDHRKKDDTWDFMLQREKGIGYVRVTAFSGGTARELRKALQQLQTENLGGLVVDLRFNPGGLLRSAIEVSDLFIAKGRIVSTKGRDSGGPERVWDAHEKGTFENVPMVVLVNRYSASGSEIVAACLQDHKRAVVMGERTWGKGSVQNVIPLEGGRSALKLTTASYRRPSGKNIHRFPGAGSDEEWGVRPDEGYALRLPNQEMMALIRDRRKRDVIESRKPSQTVAVHSGPQAPATTAGPSESAPKEHVVPKEDATRQGVTAPKPPETAPPQVEPSTPHDGTPPEKAQREAADGPSAPEPEPEFVDRQLRMAVDYLTAALARAG